MITELPNGSLQDRHLRKLMILNFWQSFFFLQIRSQKVPFKTKKAKNKN
jgi:hypothetical protein